MLHVPELVRPFQVVNSHWQTVSEPLNSEEPASQNSIAALPVVTYQAGETVIADGSRTARLFILKQGAVAIVKEDTEIAKVTEPGAVFGELSVLLNQPNKLEVRALEPSQFQIADATVLLRQNSIAIHVAMALARQLDNANDLQMYQTLRWVS
jgi:CRP/FNR family transcriptional regulator, cyclic AMP receptor protein